MEYSDYLYRDDARQEYRIDRPLSLYLPAYNPAARGRYHSDLDRPVPDHPEEEIGIHKSRFSGVLCGL